MHAVKDLIGAGADAELVFVRHRRKIEVDGAATFEIERLVDEQGDRIALAFADWTATKDGQIVVLTGKKTIAVLTGPPASRPNGPWASSSIVADVPETIDRIIGVPSTIPGGRPRVMVWNAESKEVRLVRLDDGSVPVSHGPSGCPPLVIEGAWLAVSRPAGIVILKISNQGKTASAVHTFPYPEASTIGALSLHHDPITNGLLVRTISGLSTFPLQGIIPDPRPLLANALEARYELPVAQVAISHLARTFLLEATSSRANRIHLLRPQIGIDDQYAFPLEVGVENIACDGDGHLLAVAGDDSLVIVATEGANRGALISTGITGLATLRGSAWEKFGLAFPGGDGDGDGISNGEEIARRGIPGDPQTNIGNPLLSVYGPTIGAFSSR